MPKSKGRRKSRKPQAPTKKVIKKSGPIPVRELPLFAHFAPFAILVWFASRVHHDPRQLDSRQCKEADPYT